jgi:uncharacterized lipoprotein NlpE involved in copper resistance
MKRNPSYTQLAVIISCFLFAWFSNLSARADSSAKTAKQPSAIFPLPATFRGILPCADCPGIEQTLTLRNDGLYRSHRVYQDKASGSFTEHGRWTSDGKRLSLNSSREVQLFELTDNKTLCQLDCLGQPIQTTANLYLRRTDEVAPINESLHWQGEFRYMADAATFTDCATGIHWPVAMTADYLATERNYTKSHNAPGAALLVNFDGRLEVRPAVEGTPIEQMVIEKFNSSQSGTTCHSLASDKGKATAELIDTYWKLVDLEGKKTPLPGSDKQQIRITLASENSRLFGFTGCNQMRVTYTQKNDELHFYRLRAPVWLVRRQLWSMKAKCSRCLALRRVTGL